MRIAMIGAKGMPATVGGVERHVEELSARVAALGFDVTAYSRSWYTGRATGSVADVRGVRVHTLPSIASKHLDAVSHTLLATLHAMRANMDVYHFHGVGPALCAVFPRVFRPRARVIVTFHCVDRLHEKWGRIARAILTLGERAACAFAHETITVSEALAAYCMRRYGRATMCIPNGIATPALVPMDAAAEVLRRFQLTPRGYLLVVARLVPHKSVHEVIAAFRRLRREHAEFSDVHLVVVGGSAFTDGYVGEIRDAAGGDSAIHLLGSQHGRTLATLYANALAFVHASTSEGLPLVVLEAAASGVVPVVSDIPAH
ncbi:glycosyltransferase family 4 protein, partial [Candidatus Uhrbacteria bacterium]|nr:glycosyltransferase family 4 protein [Candidatus Uhrbacteria bacterium]